MERFDRFYTLHGLLSSHRYPVPLKRIMEELECSKASATRLIGKMRLHLDAPIEYDRKANGYYYDHNENSGHPYELPGLWFSTAELHALLTAQTLLERVDPGIYSQQLRPLRQRIEHILKETGENPANITKRIRILSIASRHFNNHTFQHISSAVLQRKQLNISYRGRQNSEASRRTLSPQRLVYYRSNWYLDAWCHLRNEFRSFAVERIEHASPCKQKARHFSEAELDNTFSAAFGIFSGPARYTAILHFTAERARWVAEEQWHPQQQSRWLENGSYELQLPYGNPTELIMDILKYGTDVEVIKPASLRNAVKDRIREMMQIYI